MTPRERIMAAAKMTLDKSVERGEVVADLDEATGTVVITVNGQARWIMPVATFVELSETLGPESRSDGE